MGERETNEPDDLATPATVYSVRNANIDHVGPTYVMQPIVNSNENPEASDKSSVEADAPILAIDNVIKPLRNLKETEAIKTTFSKVRNKTNLILHCYGVPGSGKSQLVRTIASRFPYDTSKHSAKFLYIKWQIQCKDTCEDVKKEFQNLVEKMIKNCFISKANTSQNLEKEFKKNRANMLLELLLNCKVPILIVIEDPTEETRELLQDFFQLFNDTHQNFMSNKFHIYLTSRLMTPIMSEDMSKQLNCYEIINVQGFNQEEGVEFLKKSEGEVDSEESRIKVYERFSGMPLGILAAKCYCQYTGISYESYLNAVEDAGYDISADEKEATLQVYGKSADHIFQAIIMVFAPEQELATRPASDNLYVNILCCVSYFHYDRLPRFLLKCSCHIVRGYDVKNPKLRNEIDVGILIHKLLQRDMCTVTKNGDVSFHEVVLNAFRLTDLTRNNFNPLKKAMQVMSVLVSKDMRRKENYGRMYQLRPHLQTLLGHIENREKILESDDDSALLQAITSHLYEMLGAILLHELHSDESEKMFQKALQKIWPDMPDIIRQQNQSQKSHIIQSICTTDKLSEKNLPANFYLLYTSWIKLRNFENEEHSFLKSKSKGNYEVVQNNLKAYDFKELVNSLQQCELLLPNEAMRSIFFPERFASILHKWSQCCLYVTCNEEQAIKFGLWLCSLSEAVSVQTKKSTGIQLMTEWLSIITGKIPLLMNQKNDLPSLKKAQRLCKQCLKNKDLTSYENGLLIKAFCPSSVTQIYLLGHLVRVNSRLVSISGEEKLVRDADEKCQDLYVLADERFSIFSGKSFVICGKYFGARKRYSQAVHCFEKYFELSSDPKFQPKFVTECWAVYNYAKSVCSLSLADVSHKPHKENAIRKSAAMLDSERFIKEDLKLRLENTLHQLKFPN